MSSQTETDLSELSRKELETRVKENENKIAELESKLETLVEYRGDDTGMKDLWVDGHPLGRVIDSNRGRIEDNEDRIEDLEQGEIDIGEIGQRNEADLPIQRMRADVLAGREDDISANVRRATIIWADYFEKSDPSNGTYTMSSAKVRKILKENDCRHDTNTVRRVMENVDSYSDDLITMKKRKGSNELEADREDAIEWVEEIKEAGR